MVDIYVAQVREDPTVNVNPVQEFVQANETAADAGTVGMNFWATIFQNTGRPDKSIVASVWTGLSQTTAEAAAGLPTVFYHIRREYLDPFDIANRDRNALSREGVPDSVFDTATNWGSFLNNMIQYLNPASARPFPE